MWQAGVAGTTDARSCAAQTEPGSGKLPAGAVKRSPLVHEHREEQARSPAEHGVLGRRRTRVGLHRGRGGGSTVGPTGGDRSLWAVTGQMLSS